MLKVYLTPEGGVVIVAGRGKRKNSNKNDYHGKKPKANLPSDFLSMRLGDDDKNPLQTNYITDNIPHPKLDSDSRTNSLPVVIPGPTMNDPHFAPLRNFPISASFKGDRCGVCKTGGGGRTPSMKARFSYLEIISCHQMWGEGGTACRWEGWTGRILNISRVS